MDRRLYFFIAIVAFCAFNVNTAHGAPQELNGSSALSSQELLPATTKAWFSIPDSQRLDEKFLETQLGKITQEESLEPFIGSLKDQVRAWTEEKNIRLGLNLQDIREVRSGEICIAGILPSQEAGISRGSHGTVLLVDVSENIDETKELLEKLAKELKARGATKEKFSDVYGAKVSKWKFPKKSRLKKHRYAYHTISGGWLLSSDSENIFREIVRRLVQIDNVRKGQTLAAQPAFQSVMNKIAVEDVEPDVLWFINPFGYVQLAKAIAREEEEFTQRNSDDWGRILQENGFDGFKGIGGSVSLATGKHELLLRTFVYKPVIEKMDVKQKRVFGLFDFTNKKKTALTPPKFISDSISGYFCAAWDMQKALKNVGHAVDTFTGKEGSLDDALNSLREDLKVDVPAVVSKFDNELFVITDTKMPIQEGSERIAIAIRLNGGHEFVLENIKKSWPQQHREFKLGEHLVVEIDESLGAEDLDIDEEYDWQDPIDAEDEVDEDEPASFALFAKRYCATIDGFLFIANNEDLMKQLLSGEANQSLNASSDYHRIASALTSMTDNTRVSFRQFSRMDRVIRPNYEMMREGKMVASDTVLARFLNHMFAAKNKNVDAKREQKIDGSKLPSDFDKHVAPYFGPGGWVMETVEDGWLFTGCMLERQESDNRVVKKEDTPATSQRN